MRPSATVYMRCREIAQGARLICGQLNGTRRRNVGKGGGRMRLLTACHGNMGTRLQTWTRSHPPASGTSRVRNWRSVTGNPPFEPKQASSYRSHSRLLGLTPAQTSTSARTGLDGHEIVVVLASCPNQPVCGSNHILIESIRLTTNSAALALKCTRLQPSMTASAC